MNLESIMLAVLHSKAKSQDTPYKQVRQENTNRNVEMFSYHTRTVSLETKTFYLQQAVNITFVNPGSMNQTKTDEIWWFQINIIYMVMYNTYENNEMRTTVS